MMIRLQRKMQSEEAEWRQDGRHLVVMSSLLIMQSLSHLCQFILPKQCVSLRWICNKPSLVHALCLSLEYEWLGLFKL